MRQARVTRVVPLVLSMVVVGCTIPEVTRPRPPIVIPEQPSQPAQPSPSTPAPPARPGADLQVRVEVVTTGVELDADGYTVEVVHNPDEMMPYHASDTVGTNGSAVFDLGVGYYFALLSGIAPNCTAVAPREYPIMLWGDLKPPLVTLGVECLAIPATQGVRVTTVTTGALPATPSFQLEIASDSGAVQPSRRVAPSARTSQSRCSAPWARSTSFSPGRWVGYAAPSRRPSGRRSSSSRARRLPSRSTSLARREGRRGTSPRVLTRLLRHSTADNLAGF